MVLTYGGHPATPALMRRARAGRIAVIFHLLNLGYRDRSAFADASAVIFPSPYPHQAAPGCFASPGAWQP